MKLFSFVAVSSLVLASCGTISAQQAAKNWLSQSNFHANTHRLAQDAHVTRKLLLSARPTAPQLHTVCGVLLLDSEAANSSLPSPDNQSNTLLANAYDTMGNAANTCFNASASRSQRVRAVAYLDRAVTLLTESQIRLRISAGVTP